MKKRALVKTTQPVLSTKTIMDMLANLRANKPSTPKSSAPKSGKKALTILMLLLSFTGMAQVTVQEHQAFTVPKNITSMTINVPTDTEVIYKETNGTRVQMQVVAKLSTANDVYKALQGTGRYTYTALRDNANSSITLSHKVSTYLMTTDKKIIPEQYKLVVIIPQHIKHVHVNEKG